MSAGRRTVVLVHGLWYGSVSLKLMARRLGAKGFACRTFAYPTVRRSVAESARRLHRFARGLEARTLDFVGHSLGGLVILRMLDEFGGLPPGRVVLLGSPVTGSAVARRLAEWPVARGLIGRSGRILTTGFAHAPSGRDTGIIAGTQGMGLGRAIERLERPHDGTVSVAETRLADAADHLQLPVSHSGLVLSARVADEVACFLDQGRFSRRSP
jgi:pimeloyl-ACP methyl ester carboxylesterase